MVETVTQMWASSWRHFFEVAKAVANPKSYGLFPIVFWRDEPSELFSSEAVIIESLCNDLFTLPWETDN